MLADTMWEMFRMTGRIEAYLWYKECLHQEEPTETESEEVSCEQQD